MTLPDIPAVLRMTDSLHWMDRPDAVRIGADAARDLGPVRAAALRLLVPVCGCLPGALAFLAVICAGLWRHGFAMPAGWSGPATLFGLAVGAAFAAKLATLLLTWVAVRGVGRSLRLRWAVEGAQT